jgi:hypothetical protein
MEYTTRHTELVTHQAAWVLLEQRTALAVRYMVVGFVILLLVVVAPFTCNWHGFLPLTQEDSHQHTSQQHDTHSVQFIAYAAADLPAFTRFVVRVDEIVADSLPVDLQCGPQCALPVPEYPPRAA